MSFESSNTLIHDPETSVIERPLRLFRSCVAAISSGFLLIALALTLYLISVTAANMLPGIIPYDAGVVLVLNASTAIVMLVAVAFAFEVVNGGPLAGIRRLVHRAKHLYEILGVRRSSHQTLTAIWLGLTGGELALGLSLLLAFIVLPATHGDVRSAAIANATPAIGGAFGAIHAALWEETLFRGLLLLAVAAVVRRFPHRHTRLGATLILLILSSAVFGYAHLAWSTANAVTAGIDGLIFGTLAIQQRSIWPAVIAHAAMNFTLVIIT